MTPTPTRTSDRPAALSVLLRAAVPLVLVGLWWFATAQGRVSPQVLPSPLAVWHAFVELLTSGQLWANLSVSLARAGVGLAIGGSIGLALGVLAGLTRLGDELVDPTVQMLRTVPFLALAPLLVVWFGIGELPKVLLIAAATAFPLYLNAHGAVRRVDRTTLEAARTFGVHGTGLVRQVVLPQALPGILVGLRLSLSMALIALIVAEQFNAPLGLGMLMTTAQQFFQTDVLLVIIALYAVWGLLADLVVRLLERVLVPWSRTVRR